MADFNFSTTFSIEQLPREIQDLIFDGLGDELKLFLKSRSTFPSALPVLFKHVCRALHRVDYQSMVEKDQQLLSLECIRKPTQIHIALDFRPSWEHLVEELTLAVPNERIFVDDEDDIKEQLPLDWDDQAVSTLLRRCPKVRKLNLKALWVKRCVSVASSRIVPYVTLSVKRPFISIPSTVQELYVEDTSIEDAASPTGVDLGADFVLWPYEHSNLLLKVKGLQHIRKLTILTPLFIDLSGKLLDVLPKLTNMGEMVIHHGSACGGLDSFIMSEIFDALSNCPQLRILEFLYPPTYEVDPLPENWPQLVPQLRLFRTSLRRFADAFGNTRPSHNIAIEVLYDSRELVDGEADEALRGMGDPRQARRFVRIVKRVTVFLSKSKQQYAEWQQERQNGRTSPTELGIRHHEEKRTVELVDCRVDETMDWYWFAFDDEEERYAQLVDRGIYNL